MDINIVNKSCNCCRKLLYSADTIYCSKCNINNKKKLIKKFENIIDWIEKEYNEQGKISIKHYLERAKEKIRRERL